MTEPQLTSEYLAVLEILLPQATPLGLWAMGIVSSLAWQHHLKPDKRLLYNASVCSGAHAAHHIFEAWARESREKQAISEHAAGLR